MRLLLTLFSIAVLGRSVDLIDSWHDTRQQAVLCATLCHALIKRNMNTYKGVLICKHF